MGNLRETDTLYESPQGCQSNLKGGYKGKGFVLKEMPPSLLLKHLAPEQTRHSCWRHSWLKAVPTLQTQACMGAAALRWHALPQAVQSPWTGCEWEFCMKVVVEPGPLGNQGSETINPSEYTLLTAPRSPFRVEA